MANSKYGYVKAFELQDPLLPETFIVYRLDGHSFHRFSQVHNFEKPNDLRALQLMDHAARCLIEEYPDIMLAFGESDEYSFLLRKSASLYNRRQAKLVSTFTSFFTSCYVLHWPKYFPDAPLQYPPSFDGRIVLYPAEQHVRDYFAWRQVDTHINNMYNTVFWALVQQGGETQTQAHATLRGTVSKDKNEILFSRFGINYNHVDNRYKKGSILVRELVSAYPTPLTSRSLVEPQIKAVVEEKLTLQSLDALLAPADALESTTTDANSSSAPQPGRRLASSPNPTLSISRAASPPDDKVSQQSVTLAPNPNFQSQFPPTDQEQAQPEAPSSDVQAQNSRNKPQTDLSSKSKKKLTKSAKKAKPKDITQLPTRIDLIHCDLIKDEFWEARPWLLQSEACMETSIQGASENKFEERRILTFC